MPLSVVTFATLPDRLVPDGSAIFHLLRNFGSSIFISLSMLAVVRSGSMAYAEISEPINLFNENFPLASINSLWNLDTPFGLGTLAVEIGRQSTLVGYNNAFVMYAMASLVALPLMLFIRIRPR